MQGTNDNSARAIEIASGIKHKRLSDPDYVMELTRLSKVVRLTTKGHRLLDLGYIFLI